MGGNGGGLHIGFMLTPEQWAKVYKEILKKMEQSQKVDMSDSYKVGEAIGKVINAKHGVKMKHFLQSEQYQEEGDPTGLGISLMSGVSSMTFDEMEGHVKMRSTLKEIGDEYGLGEPRFYMVDEECY